MCPKIESLSDTDLLGVLVGPRHAVHLLRDSSGSLSQLLHEPLPDLVALAKVYGGTGYLIERPEQLEAADTIRAVLPAARGKLLQLVVGLGEALPAEGHANAVSPLRDDILKR